MARPKAWADQRGGPDATADRQLKPDVLSAAHRRIVAAVEGVDRRDAPYGEALFIQPPEHPEDGVGLLGMDHHRAGVRRSVEPPVGEFEPA